MKKTLLIISLLPLNAFAHGDINMACGMLAIYIWLPFLILQSIFTYICHKNTSFIKNSNLYISLIFSFIGAILYLISIGCADISGTAFLIFSIITVILFTNIFTPFYQRSNQTETHNK